MKLFYGKKNKFIDDNGFVPMKTTNKEGLMVTTDYFINRLGEIVRPSSTETGYTYMKYIPDKNGYDRQGYNICGNVMMKRRSILVAQNFIPNPHNYPCVNHINRDIMDNRVENLEWVSIKQNCQHEKRTRHLRKITPDYPIIQIKDIGDGYYQIINRYNSKKNIPTCIDNKKIDKSNIIAVCNPDPAFRHRQTYRGYIWVYEKDLDNFKKEHNIF